MPAKLRRCSPRPRDAPFNRADWMWEPKLDGYRVLAFIDERRRAAALAARPRARRRHFPQLAAELAQQAVGRHDPRRRDRRVRRRRQAVVQRAAGPRAAEDASARSRRPTERAGRLLLLRPAALRRHRPARRAVRGPAPLSRAMPAAVAAACSSCTRPRTASRCTPPRSRSGFEGVVGKRKDSRYEPGKRSRRLAQGEADARARDFVDRRLHAGQGLARAARRAAGRLLGRRQAALRVARRLGLRRRARSRRCSRRGCEPLETKTCPFAEKPELQRPDDLGRARARRRGEVPELDRRTAVCARRCSCGCATTSIRSRCGARSRRAARAAAPAAAGDRVDDSRRAARQHEGGAHARGRRRTGSSSRISTASTGRRTRR